MNKYKKISYNKFNSKTIVENNDIEKIEYFSNYHIANDPNIQFYNDYQFKGREIAINKYIKNVNNQIKQNLKVHEKYHSNMKKF